MADFDRIMAERRNREQERKNINYQTFADNYKIIIGDDVHYNGNVEFKVCEEPYIFIKRLDEYENSRRKCKKVFKEYSESFSIVTRPSLDEEKAWFNSCDKSLNIRIGFRNYARDDMSPIVLDEGKNGHILLIGQAGVGKTEILHTVIISLLREYSPVAVDLYLANMQFESETTEAIKPYCKLCEDYNEVRDVVVLLSYLRMCMTERVKLLTRLGVETIGELVKEYEADNSVKLLVKRKVLILDRLASVMQEASLKEVEQINELLNDILTDGARAGIHLILSGRDLSENIKKEVFNLFGNIMAMKVKHQCSMTLFKDGSAEELEPGEILYQDKVKNEGCVKYKAPFMNADDPDNAIKAFEIIKELYADYKADGISYDEFTAYIEMLKDRKADFGLLESSFLTYQEVDKLNKFIDERNNTLDYSDFKDGFIRVLEKNSDRFSDEISRVKYEGNLVVCPEPFLFIKDYDKAHNQYEDDSFGETSKESQDIYWEILGKDLEANVKRFPRINMSEKPNGDIWFNKTDRGINLRPGLQNNNRNNPFAVTMGNECVHGVIVGRTGAGKSVFLNNLIFNMMLEYSPWELDLYLVDFKKVELSRYMTKGVTPHVNAVAATSEVRYVVSLIEYLVNCMNARQNYFSKLGVKDIKGFRSEVKKRFGVDIVLPRVLLLVDEFQQMFLEATSREASRIEEMLTAITKLGRATGFHLLFASQEMSSTISPSVFANFKIRFALPCEADISSSILGNSAAAHIKTGEVLLNTEAGAEEDNKKYKVPFINDKNEEFFYDYLSEMRKQCEKYGLKKHWKFYEEDKQDKMDNIEKINLDYFENKRKILERGNRYLDVITLGDPVVYNNKDKDWETFFIERGTNKNIMVASPNVDDLVYIEKLLAINFSCSTVRYQHMVFTGNRIMNQMYDLTNSEELGRNVMYSSENLDDISLIEGTFEFRRELMDAISASRDDNDFINYIPSLPNVSITEEKLRSYVGDDFSYKNIPSIIGKIDEEDAGLIGVLKVYKDAKDRGLQHAFSPMIVWVTGVESLEKSISTDFLKYATDVNMILIFFTSSVDDIDIDLRLSNDYIFVGGNAEQFYDKFDVPYTKKRFDSIVIDFKIKSLNIVRSFKKCIASFEESTAPSLDFDEEI